jgi:hypothetical protein
VNWRRLRAAAGVSTVVLPEPAAPVFRQFVLSLSEWSAALSWALSLHLQQQQHSAPTSHALTALAATSISAAPTVSPTAPPTPLPADPAPCTQAVVAPSPPSPGAAAASRHEAAPGGVLPSPLAPSGDGWATQEQLAGAVSAPMSAAAAAARMALTSAAVVGDNVSLNTSND